MEEEKGEDVERVRECKKNSCGSFYNHVFVLY